MLQYLGLLILVLAGPPIGMLLARIAPDERENGERVFVILHYALLTAIGMLLLWSSQTDAIRAIGVAMGMLLFLNTNHRPHIHHALVGITYWFAATTTVFPMIVLFLFLLGMTGGTLAATPKALKQKRFWQLQWRTYISTVWPVLIAIPLFFT